ncbi:MAG: 23S rRNA (guanosine(2251)-2'-O)-methyltransferase RlmB [Kiritimatiellia bacterium]|jgi:23S rRNA (guanosine2251-2'-O)-methyltransferase
MTSSFGKRGGRPPARRWKEKEAWRRPGGKDAPRTDAGERGDWIYGRRPVLETLCANRRHVHQICLAEGAGGASGLAEIRDIVESRGIPFRLVSREELDELAQGGNHQGVAMRVGGFPYVGFDQVLHDVRENAQALVLALDHISDPQNVGSLLRSADAAGATAVILPEDRAAGVTPAATRASAGASEHMRVAKVVNLARALRDLKDAGAWVNGLDVGEDATTYTKADLKGRCVLVVGSEGDGLGRLVRETCDRIISIPMGGKVSSLNAAVAGALVLYEAVRQRG